MDFSPINFDVETQKQIQEYPIQSFLSHTFVSQTSSKIALLKIATLNPFE